MHYILLGSIVTPAPHSHHGLLLRAALALALSCYRQSCLSQESLWPVYSSFGAERPGEGGAEKLMEPIGIGMGVPEPQRRDLEMMEARLGLWLKVWNGGLGTSFFPSDPTNLGACRYLATERQMVNQHGHSS